MLLEPLDFMDFRAAVELRLFDSERSFALDAQG